MAVSILIKPEEKAGLLNSVFGKKKEKLTLSGLKKIAGSEFVYGHRNRRGYVFSEQEEEDITDIDIVLYNPQKIGRGMIVYTSEDGSIETVLNVPCTTQDVQDYFSVTKRLCQHFNVNEAIVDNEKTIPANEIDEMEEGIIPWNKEVLKNYLESNRNCSFIVLGGENPITMEEEVRDKLLQMSPDDAEREYADYINEKQQMDVYHMYPTFYNSADGILGVYALTEGVDSAIPAEPNIPFNSGLSEDTKKDDISKWIVSLVLNMGDDYGVGGYILYEDFIKNLPQEKLSKYDESHYVLKGLTHSEMESLLRNQISL